MKPRIPTEREVQRAVVQLYRTVGCKVYSLSQGYRPGGRRHGTTRQTKGIPDLYVMPPMGAASAAPWWQEVKRMGGEQSPEQQDFEVECHKRGVGYVLGGTAEAMLYLELRKIARRAK